MQEYATLREAMDACERSRTFAFTHLHREERPIDMHIHDFYEIYYDIEGGKEFLIDDRLYDLTAGDLFCINQYESHHILYNEDGELERIVFFIHPDYVRKLNTEHTQLDACFLHRPGDFSHKKALTEEQRRMFLYHISQIRAVDGYASDVLAASRISEFLVYLNLMMMHNDQPSRAAASAVGSTHYLPQVQDAISYINVHLHEPLTLSDLAEQLFLSESYLCRIFKASTGTTISKYIVGRRIAVAKTLLASGFSVTESQERCGFSDYSNFLKAFTRSVGMSPKKYSQLCQQSHSLVKN